ncbi:MAG: hypothetical protein P8X95_15115 [Anaerolineales bacterium]|jgi:hypothetical protein
MTASSQPAPKRPRGGQKGNQNALKHGFYSRQLRPSELRDLQEVESTSLKEEIDMQRVVARRLMECIKQAQTPTEIAKFSRTLATVVNTLDRLVRTQRVMLGPPQTEGERTLDAVILELTREWNLDSDEPPDPPIKFGEFDLEKELENIRSSKKQNSNNE